MDFAKWITVKHFFSAQGLAGTLDWTRQSLDIFSNCKWLQYCSWEKKPTNTKSFIYGNKQQLRIPGGFSFGTWRGAPFQQLCDVTWMSRCTLSRRQSSNELCPGLRAISLSYTCRWTERRHFVTECISMLFIKWLIYCMHGSLFTERLLPRGMWNKQVSVLVPQKRHMISTFY